MIERKYVVLLFGLLFFGCIGGGGSAADPLAIAKESGTIQQFLNQHPTAVTKIVYLDATEFAPMASGFSADCGKTIAAKAYYKVTFDDVDVSAVALVTEDAKTVVCAIIKPKGGAPAQTGQAQQAAGTQTSGQQSGTEGARVQQQPGVQLAEFKGKTYSVMKPADWIAEIQEDKFLEVSSGDKDVVIWPLKLTGAYLKFTAVDTANYIVGEIKKKLPDFQLVSAAKSPDDTKMEVVATYSVEGKKMKGAFTMISDGKGNHLFAGYEAPIAEFDSYETLFRQIALSYKPILPAPSAASTSLQLKDWSDGQISMKIPAGWQTAPGGSCETKFVQVFDPQNAARRVFYFSEIGPVYTDPAAKQRDTQYCEGLRAVYGPSHPCTLVPGGSTWYDAPVVESITEEGFLKALPAYFQMEMIKKAAPNIEPFDLQITGKDNSQPPIFNVLLDYHGAGGKAEGKMYVGYLMPMQVVGTMHAGMVVGVSAEPGAFAALQATLTESVKSIQFDSSYASSCNIAIQQRGEAFKQIGKTLSETSDIITSGHAQRQQVYDVISEKRSDVTRGVERVYNPDTNEVYEVPNGFYQSYDIHRENFVQSNLQTLTPSQYNQYVPLDGAQHIQLG